MDWGKLKTKVILTIQERISSRLQKMLTKQGSIFDKGEASGLEGEEVEEPVSPMSAISKKKDRILRAAS